MMIFNQLKLKYLPLLFLATFTVAFFYFHLQNYLSFATIQTEEAYIQAFISAHYFIAVCLYIFIYILLIACGIPVASLLCVLGGFLFGAIAIIYAIFSLTFGGLLLYLAVQSALGERIANASSARIKKMEAGFRHHAFNYLLMMRLVPIFPCWVCNIAAGALNVPLKAFLSATILGVFPTTFLYVMAGYGLDQGMFNFNWLLHLTPLIH